MKKIDKSAVIAKTAVIHEDVVIEADVVIHDYVVIYPHTLIKAGTEIYDHCVLGKYPKTTGVTARKLREEYGQVIVGENCVLSPGVVLYTEVEIGSMTLLGDYCSIREECKIGTGSIIGRGVNVNYHTQIGNHTKIMDSAIITGNMKIGNHVFISMGVITSNDNTMGREKYDEGHIVGPTIEDDVTIGAGANLFPGVHIGKNAMVGASALVTRDVPENMMVMGIPARVVREVK